MAPFIMGGGFGAMFEVVPVLRNEREQLFKMIEDYWRTRLSHKPSADDPCVRDKRFDEEFWNERESRFLWWAKLNETAIGFAKTELIEDLVWETQGEIGDFYIAPPFRRRGHGKAFARLLLNWFGQEGAKYVRLYVRSDNPGALAFWENEEFETVQIWHLAPLQSGSRQNHLPQKHPSRSHAPTQTMLPPKTIISPRNRGLRIHE